MFRMSGVLFVVLIFGCTTFGVTAPQGKESLAIRSSFPYPCNGPYKDQKLSDEIILKVRQAHEKWLKGVAAPEGQKADLCGAKLSHGKFKEAELTSAVFQMAMLAGADFTGSLLNKAQLQGANLSGVIFRKAHLKGAELDHAMLHLAVFQKTDLHKASLRHAMLYKTIFHGVDLTDVEGLTQSQINMACLDDETKLPQGLNRPERCTEKTSN